MNTAAAAAAFRYLEGEALVLPLRTASAIAPTVRGLGF